LGAKLQTPEPIRKGTEDNFALSFVAGVASYSLFSVWLNLVPGFVALGGGFLLTLIATSLFGYAERRKLREARRADRVDLLFRLVEKANASKAL